MNILGVCEVMSCAKSPLVGLSLTASPGKLAFDFGADLVVLREPLLRSQVDAEERVRDI